MVLLDFLTSVPTVRHSPRKWPAVLASWPGLLRKSLNTAGEGTLLRTHNYFPIWSFVELNCLLTLRHTTSVMHSEGVDLVGGVIK